MSTFYVSGGMTNLPDFNFPMFDEVSEALRADGHTVFSPAENDRVELEKRGILDVTKVPGYAEGDVSRYNESIGDTKDLFRWDFGVIINECTGIVMLPGWETSTGARWERVVAEALGLQVVLAVTKASLGDEGDTGWAFLTDDEQDSVSQFLREFPNAEHLLHEVPQAPDAEEPDTMRTPTEDDLLLAGLLSTIWPLSNRHPQDAVHIAIFLNDLTSPETVEPAEVVPTGDPLDAYAQAATTGELIRELQQRIGHSPNFREHFPKALAGIAPEALS